MLKPVSSVEQQHNLKYELDLIFQSTRESHLLVIGFSNTLQAKNLVVILIVNSPCPCRGL